MVINQGAERTALLPIYNENENGNGNENENENGNNNNNESNDEEESRKTYQRRRDTEAAGDGY